MFKYFPTNYVWNLSVDLAIEMGARIGEIEAMCAPLQEAAKAPDKAGTQAFRETWVKMADQLCELADEDKARGRMLSAGEKLNRAASYLITAERLQAHGSEGRVALYRRHLDLFAEGVAPQRRDLRTGRDPLRRQAPVGAVCAGRGCQRPRAAAGAGQRPGLHQGDEIPRRPAGLAGQARRRLADRRPAGHRRGAAPAGLHCPLRQRALGQPRRRLAGDARRRRCQAHRHGRRVARRLLLPARRGLRAAFCRRRGLGCQPRLARCAEAPAREGRQLPGAALLVACVLGLGRQGHRRLHEDRRERAPRRRGREDQGAVPGHPRREGLADPAEVGAPHLRAADQQPEARTEDLHRPRRRRAAQQLRQLDQRRPVHRRLGRRDPRRPHCSI